jgi:hypothetical protein
MRLQSKMYILYIPAAVTVNNWYGLIERARTRKLSYLQVHDHIVIVALVRIVLCDPFVII